MHSTTNCRLEELGFTKMVNEIDAKEAARLGLQTRPLTTAVIQKHLEDVGIEPEFGTHSRMRGLSGGQKVLTLAWLDVCLSHPFFSTC